MKITSTNPSRNYEVIGAVEVATAAEVHDAVAKARAAQPAWAALSVGERWTAIQSFMAVCRERAEDIATLMAREVTQTKLISEEKAS